MKVLKKFFSYLRPQLKYFLLNPFWTSWVILTILLITVILNGFIWYEYLTKFNLSVNSTPIVYSSAVLILNLFLANIAYRKQSLLSYILLGTSLVIQVFFLFFLKIAIFVGAY